MKSVHGPRLKVYVGSPKAPKTIINHKTLFQIQTTTNMSGRKIKQIAQILNDSNGVAIQPHFKEALIDKNSTLADFFEVETIEMLVKLKDKNCDWIIANDISKDESGFDNENNEVTIFYKNEKMKKEKLSLKKKSEISEEIVDRIVAQIN